VVVWASGEYARHSQVSQKRRGLGHPGMSAECRVIFVIMNFRFPRDFVTRCFLGLLVVCLLLKCAIQCMGQAGDSVSGHIFHSDIMGITYAFPERFYSKVESEMVQQPRDPSGREHVVLALWDAPERVGIPRMAFLHDTKPRPAGYSRDAMAARYLEAMKQTVGEWRGVKISAPRKIQLTGYDAWRLDYWHPANSAPPYNSAVVVPLGDRSILAIQVNAPSQSELDSEIDSLRELRFEDSKRPK